MWSRKTNGITCACYTANTVTKYSQNKFVVNTTTQYAKNTFLPGLACAQKVRSYLAECFN